MTFMTQPHALCLLFLVLISHLCTQQALSAVESAVENNAPAITSPQQTESATKKKQATAAFLHIAENIDPWQSAYIQRAIADAVAQKVDYIVTHIDTYGGRVDSAIEILNAYLALEGPDAPKTIAFISSKAISAGALISYGHHEIYMSNHATIGNIGVIFVNAEGKMEYAPEKSKTLVRAQLAIASRIRGWDYAWLQKMTALNQDIYLIRHANGEQVYIIEDDLPKYLADHQDIYKENSNQVILIQGKDRLVTESVEDAVEYNIATGKVKNLEEVYTLLGVDSTQVINLAPSETESISRILGAWAPLLLSLTILLIFLELKTAGVGLFAILACITGVLYGICQYYQNLANYWELTCILLGIALIAVELYTLASGGMLAIAGGMLALFGIFMSFLPEVGQFSYNGLFNSEGVTNAAYHSMNSLLFVLIGLFAIIASAPKIKFFQRLTVNAEITATGASAEEVSGVHIGKTGVVIGELMPSGQVDLGDGLPRSAKSRYSNALELGQAIEVVAHEFGDLIVRAIDQEPASTIPPTPQTDNSEDAS